MIGEWLVLVAGLLTFWLVEAEQASPASPGADHTRQGLSPIRFPLGEFGLGLRLPG